MGVDVTVTDAAVEIGLTGLDAVLALRGHVTLPLAQVTGAAVEPVGQPKAELGWRVAGGYWPGRFATGRFAGPAKGQRQFWSVYRDPDVLVVDLDGSGEWARAVLQHPDRAALAEVITARLGRR